MLSQSQRRSMEMLNFSVLSDQATRCSLLASCFLYITQKVFLSLQSLIESRLCKKIMQRFQWLGIRFCNVESIYRNIKDTKDFNLLKISFERNWRVTQKLKRFSTYKKLILQDATYAMKEIAYALLKRQAINLNNFKNFSDVVADV